MSRMLEFYIRQGFPCLFHLLTGLYCPGCGGTRAVKYLLHGQILKSIQYHPLIFYTAAVIAVGVTSHYLAIFLNRSSLKMKNYDRYVYIGIGLIAVNWVLKNYMLIVHGIDLLSDKL